MEEKDIIVKMEEDSSISGTMYSGYEVTQSDMPFLRHQISRCSSYDVKSAPYDKSVRKQRNSRDPNLHRIIEKKRRDRMNNCLTDLGELIPANYLRPGQGRLEKTEILEMATKHIRDLQDQNNSDHKTFAENYMHRGYMKCIHDVMRHIIQQSPTASLDQSNHNLLTYLRKQSEKFKPNQDENLASNISAESALNCIPHSSNSEFFKNGQNAVMEKQTLSVDKEEKFTGVKDVEPLGSMKTVDGNSTEVSQYKFKCRLNRRFQSTSNSEEAKDSGVDIKSDFTDDSEVVALKEATNLSKARQTSVAIQVQEYELEPEKTEIIPAFALHPASDVYVPLMLPISQIMSKLKVYSNGQIVRNEMCHPVSILVDFAAVDNSKAEIQKPMEKPSFNDSILPINLSQKL